MYRVDILETVHTLGPDVPERYRWACACQGTELQGLSDQPLPAACKTIKPILLGGQGVEGPVQGTAYLYWPGRDDWSDRCSVEWGYRVSETRKLGPRIERWKSMPPEIKWHFPH